MTTLRLAPETATLKAGEHLEPRSEAFVRRAIAFPLRQPGR